ncbi:MAG: DUF2070 family protein [Candidatus Bathyarchaeia archaeon]
MVERWHRDSIDLAVRHYSSLFKLPSYRVTLILLCAGSLVLGLAANIPFTPSLQWVFSGLLIGLMLLITTLLADFLALKILLRGDIILNAKRIFFLSFSSNLLLSVFALLANLTALLISDMDLPVKILFIGFFAALCLRLLVTCSISFSRDVLKVLSGIIQPLLALLTIYATKMSNTTQFAIYTLISILLSLLSIRLYTAILDRAGLITLGIPSLKLFRAFLADWTEGIEHPFEEILERLGEERSINISMLMFRSMDGRRMKAIMVIPNLHPGPFRNIGSSPLPGLIEEALERNLQCIVSVPHGISGHELDLASQRENRKVLEALIGAVRDFCGDFSTKVTPFIYVEMEGAKVGCQVFNGCALLTLTVAPETMEDLPLELNDIILRKAREEGFLWAIAIDAHNSINGPFKMDRAVSAIKNAATAALERASKLKYSASPPRVGAGKSIPEGLGLKDGMGPGGITAIVIEVDGQRTAYITVDGNNMVSGLRDKILTDIRDLGIDCGEVFTTDTHAVNAVAPGGRGYHPVGEVIGHEAIVGCVRRAIKEALNNMEAAEAAWLKITVPSVKVIGEMQIDELSLLTDKVSRRAGSLAALFPLFGLTLAILLILL